jgi:hypothetical protein
MNPTFRRIRLKDLNLEHGAEQKLMKMETGPYFVDMATSLQ